MKYNVPLDALPNQNFTLEMDGKDVELEFLTRGPFLYANIKVDSQDKLNGIVCQNKCNLFLYPNIGINGKLYFEDTQGSLDPIYFGLGTRWILVYEDE